ncbi:MAG: small multi-drug export protein [Candidatus Aenigmarchaeota archaeon]|nr:small multi-drug export protein [Candidatus Aenigmarchaeota archaeon]
MIDKILLIIALTFLPTLELRASIPYGVYILELPILQVFLISILSNILVGIIVFLLLIKLTNYFLKYQFFSRIYNKIVLRVQRKTKKHIDKYGLLGLVLFIAIPLPGSGSWTGALAAYVFGIKFKSFILANIIGVIIAGILVSLAVLGTLSIPTII